MNRERIVTDRIKKSKEYKIFEIHYYCGGLGCPIRNINVRVKFPYEEDYDYWNRLKRYCPHCKNKLKYLRKEEK